MVEPPYAALRLGIDEEDGLLEQLLRTPISTTRSGHYTIFLLTESSSLSKSPVTSQSFIAYVHYEEVQMTAGSKQDQPRRRRVKLPVRGQAAHAGHGCPHSFRSHHVAPRCRNHVSVGMGYGM